MCRCACEQLQLARQLALCCWQQLLELEEALHELLCLTAHFLPAKVDSSMRELVNSACTIMMQGQQGHTTGKAAIMAPSTKLLAPCNS